MYNRPSGIRYRAVGNGIVGNIGWHGQVFGANDNRAGLHRVNDAHSEAIALHSWNMWNNRRSERERHVLRADDRDRVKPAILLQNIDDRVCYHPLAALETAI